MEPVVVVLMNQALGLCFLPSLLSKDFLASQSLPLAWLLLFCTVELGSQSHAVPDDTFFFPQTLCLSLTRDFCAFYKGSLCVASGLLDPLHLKAQCWFWIFVHKQNVWWDLRGRSVYFVAIVELQGLPYLLVPSSTTVLLAAVKISPCVLLLFHICRCSSAFGLQSCRTQT